MGTRRSSSAGISSDNAHGFRIVDRLERRYPDFPGLNLTYEVRESMIKHANGGVPVNFRPDEASLLEAIAVNPRHPVAHNELGIVYRRTGRFEEARKSYEVALELQPSFHFARKNLAILCDLFISDVECALKHYELYREAVPDDKSVEIWIADLRNRNGQ